MKKLTAAQLANFKEIREAGGVVEQDRYGFHKPGERASLRGMNSVAVRSLIKLGHLTLTEGTDRNTITVIPKPATPELTPSEVAARQWQRERFGETPSKRFGETPSEFAARHGQRARFGKNK